MTNTLSRALLALVLAASAATPLSAANKEHQQLMADIRMLQEQAQLLQNMLGAMTEAMKAMDARLDQRLDQLNGTAVKGFADQKLALDNLTNDARVIREKLDDNSVRLGSLSQEVDAIRQQLTARSVPAWPDVEATGTDPSGGPPPPATAPGLGAIDSPNKTWDAAYADYVAGQYDLAVLGFDAYIKSFPKSPMADDAQVYICASYLNDAKDDLAVDACDLAIRTYPSGDALPEAYYRKGVALNNLKDVSGARAAWEFVVKTAPETNPGRLARQGLDKLKR
jgi:TolA-binding protein